MNPLIRENERLDDLGLKGLSLIQDPKYFCFGIDAVLLSSFAKVHSGEKVLDLCSGNGIIPVLLYGKTEAKKIYGLEIQKALWDLAKRSIEYNKIEEKVEMVCGDLKEADLIFDRGSFDVVTANPPYMQKEAGILSETDPVKLARHEEACNFSDVCKAARGLLKEKGRFYLVHRPLRLVEILSTMREYSLEPKAMRLVHPFRDKEPNLVLIEGIKGAKPELRCAPPLVVYEAPGKYTKEVLKIYGYE